MSEELNALLDAEKEKTTTEYCWDMSWQTRGASCSTSPVLNMPLWIAILDAQDAIDSLMDEEDYDEDYSETPTIRIDRFIDGKFDDSLDFLEDECFSEVVAWADENWVQGEWSAHIQRVNDYHASFQKNANA